MSNKTCFIAGYDNVAATVTPQVTRKPDATNNHQTQETSSPIRHPHHQRGLIVVIVVLAIIVAGLLAAVIALAVTRNNGTASAGGSTKRQPNIIVIMADDLGWNDLGYHNNGTDIRTPYIDQLAGEGIKLENYYVQPLCTPSRATFLSGLYPIHTGLGHDVVRIAQPNGLPVNLPTLPGKLREAGYATHLVGKWHIGHARYEQLPIHRGFDTYFGNLWALQNHFNHTAGEVFNVGGQTYNFFGNDLRDGDAPYYDFSTYSTVLYANKVQSIIKQHAATQSDKPLFIDLALTAPHWPVQAPQEYIDMFKDTIADENRLIYVAMMACVDDAIRNVTNAFKEAGLWDNTILVFTTDNGGFVNIGGDNYPLRGQKNTVWEGGVRGVAFINSPLLNLNGHGRVSRDLMHISDWFPTFVGLAGGDVSSIQLDGYNLWPTLSAGATNPRQEVLFQIDPLLAPRGSRLNTSAFDNRIQASIRSGNWKLIVGEPGDGNWYAPPNAMPNEPLHPRGVITNEFLTGITQFINGYVYRTSTDTADRNKNIWLFDIDADPYEITDVSATHPDIVSSLLDRLAHYNSTAVPILYPPYDPAADPNAHGGWLGPWILP